MFVLGAIALGLGLSEVYPMSRTILKFRGVGRHPFCYSTSAFTRREGRATLGSDLSALRGLAKGAGFIQVNPLLLPLENKSDKPRGLGQSPSYELTDW